MSHYTVPFPRANMTNAEKELAALNAAKDYIGDNRRYKRVLGALQEILNGGGTRTQKMRSCYMALSFAGIQGRWPVRALVKAAAAAN